MNPKMVSENGLDKVVERIWNRYCFALFQASREQLAIAEFANSLLVIPKTLTVNAAKDSVDLVAKLRAYHNASQVQADKAQLKWYVLFWFHLYLVILLAKMSCILQLRKKKQMIIR